MTQTLDIATPDGPDLTDCDREPIHVPEAIQPHGLLFVLDATELWVRREAGRLDRVTGRDSWLNQSISSLIGDDLARRLRAAVAAGVSEFIGRWRGRNGLDYDAVVRPGGAQGVVLELEQSSQAALLGVDLIGLLDTAASSLERAASVVQVCERAAEAFRTLTGFDRIMIYRFLDDEAGQVVAEAKADEADSFQNHHFPATDIPRQARALYLRNPVRVIADAHYEPQPLRPAAEVPLDMSDCGLRSVSPVHIQYLRNMGVRASASVSIIVDDELWGLVACHSSRSQLMPYETRLAATNLARSLARQIKSKGDAELYRERVRLRQLEDELVARLPQEPSLPASLGQKAETLRTLVDADGVAILGIDDLTTAGVTPQPQAIRDLAAWVIEQPGLRPIASHRLSSVFPAAEALRDCASGLLAVHLPGEQPLTILWFRAEIVETIRWAGNPASAVKTGPGGALTPRASFEAWSQTVHGRSRRWTVGQAESAARLRDALGDFAAVSRLRSLNRSLQASLSERERRLEQQTYLMREVNHRVQNSLTLVSSFLGLQARQADPAARDDLMEARRRVRSVSMVHSRLYRDGDQANIDMGRYVSDLLDDLGDSVGPEWSAAMQRDLAPVSIEAGRAVTIGLILTELVINAQKYAYDGEPGPITVRLEEDDTFLRLIVQDAGKGGHQVGQGFGSMMIRTLVGQLGGKLDYLDGHPGLRAVLRAPITAP